MFISHQRSSALSVLQQRASNGVAPPSGRWWLCSDGLNAMPDAALAQQPVLTGPLLWGETFLYPQNMLQPAFP